jgi:thiamine biosynthesis protein ThiS
VINLTVNEKPREMERAMSLLEFLQELGINPRIVAVEHNGEIIRRERYGETPLAEGDVLEIVRMVGGGGL